MFSFKSFLSSNLSLYKMQVILQSSICPTIRPYIDWAGVNRTVWSGSQYPNDAQSRCFFWAPLLKMTFRSFYIVFFILSNIHFLPTVCFQPNFPMKTLCFNFDTKIYWNWCKSYTCYHNVERRTTDKTWCLQK